ncbi:MAG: YCF48-related protein [Gammaproteobacteria bacterium]|nr:YCF48-related protein [Gammaproteobacteria bacterium]
MTNENPVMKALRRLALVPLIAFGFLSILATGGGGGGGGGVGTPESPATITTTNAAELINDVIGTSDPTGGIAAASTQQGTTDGQSLSSARALAQRLETVYQTTLSGAQAASQRFAPAIAVDETEPCDFGQGTIHSTGTINNDGTGTLNVTYNNCLLDGLTHNGQATLQVTAFNLTFFVPTDFTFSISSLTITGPGVNQTVSGSLRDQLNLGTDTETTTFDLTTTDNVSGKTIRTHNLVFVFVYNDIFSPSSYTLTMTGRVWDSLYGYVDVSTVTPFVFSSISQLFPDSGQIILTGAGNASIRVTALSSVLLTVALDLDGDSVYELTATLTWTDLDGPIGADLGDDDGDGMHNSWETFYGLTPSDPVDAGSDGDGDLFANLGEYLSGTNPNNPTSIPTNAFSVSGTVAGLAGSGLVLQNNGGDDLAISGNGAFLFATPLADGDTYNVTVLSQPTSPAQTCSVTNGSGRSSGANVTNVSVNCVPAPTGVRAVSGNGQITLSWEPVPGASSYTIYFANETGVTKLTYLGLAGGAKIEGVSSPHVHNGLTNGSTYFYVVTATNAFGEGRESLQIAAQPLTHGWEWLDPKPTGNDLWAVHFVGANTGWAVGDAGTIIHTSDGGVTWGAQVSGTPSRLHDVHFVDALKGWAVGGLFVIGSTRHATILHTEDGGVTWHIQASGNVEPLAGIHFIDSLTGWSVGGDGMILHTTDGGRTWNPQPSGVTQALWKVTFVDALNGWIAGGSGFDGVILRTSDGGATWSAQVFGGQLFDLDFASATLGWAVDPASAGRILATNNGGSTWGPQPTSTGAFLRGIDFVDILTGWAVGTGGEILKTTNGGGLWVGQSSGTTRHLNAVAAIDVLTAWAVGTEGTIVHTADGGTTWVPQHVRALELPAGAPLTLDAIWFTDATTGWALGGGASVFRTSDAGVTWIAQPTFASETLHWIQFVDTSTGWAVGENGNVYRTIDGGNTWTLQGNIGVAQVWSVDFVDATTGWAVTPSGEIRKTVDGGVSWTSQASGTLNALTQVKAVNASTAWIVGMGGLILKTTDGGATWLGQISGTSQDLRGIAVIDAMTAWAVGGGSSAGIAPILATTDGGATWVSQNSTITHWFNDVFFANATTGWAVGPNGRIAATTDSGATWALQNADATLDLFNVRAVDPLTAWIRGRGLLRTTTGGK